MTGGEVVPNFLAGQSWTRIAAGLRRPATPAAATILTAANMLTSQLCKLTGDRPAAACPKWVRSARVIGLGSRVARGSCG